MMFDSSLAPWGVERQGSGLQGAQGAAFAGSVASHGGGSVPQINLDEEVPAAGKKTCARYNQDRADKKGNATGSVGFSQGG